MIPQPLSTSVPNEFFSFETTTSSSSSWSNSSCKLTRSKTFVDEDDLLSPFIVDFKEMKLERVIGEGRWSKVYLAEWLFQPVAVKILQGMDSVGERNTTEEAGLRERLVKEIGISSQLRHPNILLFMGASLDGSQPLSIVSEYFESGSLADLISSVQTLTLEQKLHIAMSIARGLLYLHSSNPRVLHRDLKLENVLVSSEGKRVVVADFGVSQLCFGGGEASGPVGTPSTMAPEVIEGEPYTPASDVYSFGIVLWEVFHQERAFYGMNATQIMYHVLQGGRPVSRRNSEMLPETIGCLIDCCLAEDPISRPSIQEIVHVLQHC